MGVLPFVVSARTSVALRAQAGRLAGFLREGGRGGGRGGGGLADVAFSLATTRAGLSQRAVVVAGDRQELLAGLESVAVGGGSGVAGVVEGVVAGGRGTGAVRPVFVFPGQGWQWMGMAEELLVSSPVFRERLEACGQALSEFTDWSLLDVLREAEGAASLERVDVVQPVLWAVMVSLAEVWRSYGVEPAAVVGHSQGEIAAACVAGALSLRDGARVVALRSQVLTELAGQGGMLSVAMPAAGLAPRLRQWEERISVAAVNGPLSVVVSGDLDALDELRETLAAEGVRVKRLPVDYASHSTQVQRLRDQLLEVLAPVSPHTADVPFYSTVSGVLMDTTGLDAAYWYENLRQTVRFEQTTRTLLEDGYRTFVEISAHPVLTIGMQETAEAAEHDDVLVVGSLQRDDGSPRRLLTALAALHVHEAGPDWERFFAGSDAGRVPLPTYAFQHQRYWPQTVRAAGDLRAVGQTPAGHPLLGAAVALAGEGERY